MQFGPDAPISRLNRVPFQIETFRIGAAARQTRRETGSEAAGEKLGETAMIDFGPAGLILISFVSAMGGIVSVYTMTGFAGREPSQRHGR